jgi:uncharacterized membrane protein YfcA
MVSAAGYSASHHAGSGVIFPLMVRGRPCAVSNHEAKVRPIILRDALQERAPQDEDLHWDARHMGFLFVLIVCLIAGTISGIVGTGSSIMLMPVLVYQYGPKQAVPIMAVAAMMANLSRILAWWHEVDWRACAVYSVTGIPAAALGARTLLALPSHAVDIAIGVFLIAMVPVRHWLARHDLEANLWHLAIGGALIGYLTGIVVSTGPLSVPLFLFYGLTKGAFLATEAASSLGLYLSKSVTFERFGALTPDVAIKGLIAGSSLMSGAFIAKRFVLKLEPDVFRLVMDGIVLVAGISLLWTAATS